VQASHLDKANDWCTKHDGCVYLLSPLGRRVNLSPEPIPTSISTALPIVYQTDRAGCASAAVSNLLYRCDAVEADRIYRIVVDHRFRHLRDLAAWLMSHTRWMLRRVQTAEKHPEALLDHVLGQCRGLFIVAPKTAAVYGNHAIGVDQARNVVYDSVENNAMVTSMESFNRCVNGRCNRFHDIRDLFSEVKSHLGSHLPTPATRLYTHHTIRHPGVASSDTVGEGDGCKGKLDS
jgi:hypothetical protein